MHLNSWLIILNYDTFVWIHLLWCHSFLMSWETFMYTTPATLSKLCMKGVSINESMSYSYDHILKSFEQGIEMRYFFSKTERTLLADYKYCFFFKLISKWTKWTNTFCEKKQCLAYRQKTSIIQIASVSGIQNTS